MSVAKVPRHVAVIVASATTEATAAAVAALDRRPDLVIAADSGLDAIVGAGWSADVIVGDLDSVDPTLLAEAEAAGAEVVAYRADKNETDLELALGEAIQRGATVIHVVIRDGGRLDHQLANLAVLAAPEWASAAVSASIGHHRVWVVREEMELPLSPGDHVALIPVGGDADAITTTGVDYPLTAGRLSVFRGRGISNRVNSTHPRIVVGTGVVLVVNSPTPASARGAAPGSAPG